MEIKKYCKAKDNTYEIHLDNGSVLNLYDDIIIKYSLLLKKSITSAELDEITKCNDDLKAYYLGLKFITKKMRSKLEVENI